MLLHEWLAERAGPGRCRRPTGYPFGFMDEGAKKEIRRAILKAVAIPGYQVPYGSREMPIARGWGTGGLQITLSLIVPDDILKVIDQGCDGSVNAVNIKKFVARVAGVAVTTDTARGDPHPDPPPHSGGADDRAADPGSAGALSGGAAGGRAFGNGDPPHARRGRLQPDVAVSL